MTHTRAMCRSGWVWRARWTYNICKSYLKGLDLGRHQSISLSHCTIQHEDTFHVEDFLIFYKIRKNGRAESMKWHWKLNQNTEGQFVLSVISQWAVSFSLWWELSYPDLKKMESLLSESSTLFCYSWPPPMGVRPHSSWTTLNRNSRCAPTHQWANEQL